MNVLEQKLKEAHDEVGLRDEVAEGLRRNKDAAEKHLMASIEQLEAELATLHQERKNLQEAWEEERWQKELERGEAKREADKAMQRVLEESEDALAKERQESTARAQALQEARPASSRPMPRPRPWRRS